MTRTRSAPTPTARGRRPSTCAAAGTSSTSARSIRTRASGPSRRSPLLITVPFLEIEAPHARGRPASRGGDLRERRDPRPGHARRTRPRSSSAPPTAARPPPAAATPSATPKPASRPAPTAPAAHGTGAVTVPVAEDGTLLDAVRADRRPLGDHRHGVQRPGQDRVADPQRDRRLPGRHRRRELKGGRAWLKVWVDGKVSDVTGAAGGSTRRARS